jgi:hypothetical protein
MIGRVLWDEFFSNNDWPMASTVAVVMICLIIVPARGLQPLQAGSAGEGEMSAPRTQRTPFPDVRAAASAALAWSAG